MKRVVDRLVDGRCAEDPELLDVANKPTQVRRGLFGRDTTKHTRLADAGIEWLREYMRHRGPVTRHVNLTARTT